MNAQEARDLSNFLKVLVRNLVEAYRNKWLALYLGAAIPSLHSAAAPEESRTAFVSLEKTRSLHKLVDFLLKHSVINGTIRLECSDESQKYPLVL